MDYEKLYKDALEWMRDMYPCLTDSLREDAEHFFPELRESEDKKIREDIIGGLMWQRDNLKSEGPHDNNLILPGFCFTVGEHLAYLEKQKEQKPSTKFHPGDWVVYDGPLGHAILQVKDVVDGRYTFVDNDSTLLEEDSDEFLRPLTPKDVEKPTEWKPQPESLEALMYAIEGKWDAISPTSYLSRRLEDLYEGLVNTYNVDESLLAELPKAASRAYTAERIEELRELKRKIEASMELK